ncbi:MAG: Phosphoribosylglycinamide formyltransferase [Microgenomates group bacterium GW2011_GWA2_46_7]|nr:MAG: Phosphoribosylglycinamide formyltransferase [Microgenomates group bacterium GW2011_GWA2_46_7]
MKKRRLAVCLSGGGSTFKYILDSIERGDLGDDVEIAVVISSRLNAGGIKHAEEAGIPVRVLCFETYPGLETYGRDIITILQQYEVNLVLMAGFLRKMPDNVLEKYKVINQHPGDTKKYGGHGMYGIHGIDIPEGITAQELQKLLLPIEHITYVAVLKSILTILRAQESN